MSEPKAAACPFCGSESVAIVEGETFRWLHVLCGGCEARGPAARRGGNWNEISERDRAEVFAEWNRRAPLATDRERRLAEAIVYLLGPAEGPDWDDATADSILNEARSLLAAPSEPAKAWVEVDKDGMRFLTWVADGKTQVLWLSRNYPGLEAALGLEVRP